MHSDRLRRDTFLNHLCGIENPLRAFIAAALSKVDERADFFQEVVLTLWRTFDRFDPSRPFLPWALGVASRRLKEEYRRLRKRPGFIDAEHLDRLAATLTEAAESPRCEEEALAECLAALPENASRLIRRRYMEAASIESLGSETGQAPAAVYQTLSRLRRRLADCIRQRLSPPKTRPVPAHES